MISPKIIERKLEELTGLTRNEFIEDYKKIYGSLKLSVEGGPKKMSKSGSSKGRKSFSRQASDQRI
jgi:hypothetical protein